MKHGTTISKHSESIHVFTNGVSKLLYSKSSLFDGWDYVNVFYDGERLILKRSGLHISKSARKLSKGKYGVRFTHKFDSPIGEFLFDKEDSTNDQIIIYYKQ